MMPLSILNYFSVLMYGLVLSLSFTHVFIKKNLKSFVFVAIGFFGAQLIIYLLLGERFLARDEIFTLKIVLPLDCA